MEFKRCSRCGCFFTSNDDVCCNCLSKDKFEMSKFKDFIEENNNITQIHSLNELSLQTGISSQNINRFLGYEDFNDIVNQINLK